MQPMSYNAWLYTYANPIKYSDPSGNNPLVAALVPALVGMGVTIIGAAAAGGIYGYCTYELAIAGQCGCEIQQQALSMSKWEYAGANALAGGLIGAAAIAMGTAAIATPLGAIVVGGIAVTVAVVDLIDTVNIIKNETGPTWCTVTRLLLDVAGLALGTIGIAQGVRAWRASGSVLQWKSPTIIIEENPIERFIGMEGDTATDIQSRITPDWNIDFKYYTTQNPPVQQIPQYTFTSPDGSVQLRVHGPQAPYNTSWVARIGLKVPAETPGAIRNPFPPNDWWLYYDNAGLPTGDLNLMHIKVNVTLADMILIFGIGE